MVLHTTAIYRCRASSRGSRTVLKLENFEFSRLDSSAHHVRALLLYTSFLAIELAARLRPYARCCSAGMVGHRASFRGGAAMRYKTRRKHFFVTFGIVYPASVC
ncbi:unnamed protein product [Ectocarpus sp. 8 AP-2014]